MSTEPDLPTRLGADTSLEREVLAALAAVQDPEIRRPVTELGMVAAVTEVGDGVVAVLVLSLIHI